MRFSLTTRTDAVRVVRLALLELPMKHFHCVIFSALFICLWTQSRAESEREAQKAIQARYNEFDRAYMRKDFAKVREVFTPDCVFHLGTEGRSMKAERALKGMEALSKALTVSHAKTVVSSVNAKGRDFDVVAIWSGDSKYVPVSKSKEDPPRQAKTKQAYRDRWKKTQKGWQITDRIIGNDADDVTTPSAPPKTPPSPPKK
jgi:ketosteroid isomerase-like protein